MKRISTVRNDFGIGVKKCCMSCAHKDCTRLHGTRYCQEHHKDVGRWEVCNRWQMSRAMQMAGNGDGRIKRREYLAYLASVREEEEAARQLGLTIPSKSVETIRSEFEQEHGSIYINI
ncbi:MAG: hypothetical protein IJ618_01305 [Prevotella sp.]|nr:hypothetical protein [Prevotella sp.]